MCGLSCVKANVRWLWLWRRSKGRPIRYENHLFILSYSLPLILVWILCAIAKEGTVININIGTTYSCVSIWQHDQVEIIANDQGNNTSLSYVVFTNTPRFIEDAVKNQVIMNPINMIFDAKRFIGRRFSDPSMQSNIKLWLFKVWPC